MTEEDLTILAATNNNGVVSTSENNAQQQQQDQQQQPVSKLESFFAITKSLILRALIIYFISSFFRRPANQDANQTVSTAGGQANIQKTVAWNYFENGTIFDFYVYVSENSNYVDFKNPNSLIWEKDDLVYGDWYGGLNGDGTYSHSTKILASKRLMNNGSLYLHAYVVKSGRSPDPASPHYAKEYLSQTHRMLSKYKKIKSKRNYNLITGGQEEIEEVQKNLNKKDTILTHWHPNITVNLVVDQTNWAKGSIPQPLDEYVEFVDNGRTYLPIVFVNDYWNMLRDYQPVNETTQELDLTVTFQPLSMFKWQLYAAQAMRNKWNGNLFGDLMTGGLEESDEDQDSIKETLLETNPYLLGLTIIVSILHSVFELLAFKNDIQFWNNRKSLEGLSVRSVFFGVFQSLIVLLYVLDNETNIMIRISCFVGLGIEVWKIQKVTDIKYDRERKIFGFLPRIEFNDKGSYVESSTKQYDKLAFKYLGWVCFPLLIGYSIYSLIYNEHKGWYSFILNMLYGYLLTFGFIMMTPQLFINYKLKSVAHLPWRMMTYKFLNTFIDDIFAFVIKMPTMYRLGCFRDDIVFFIFLYQRWIYKVDHKRINEFGFSGEMIDNKDNKAIENSNVSNTEKSEEEEIKTKESKKKD
ncbi:putative lipid scramblase CLPTM1 [Condylostylus longicornis]|uniref:putative lipid scramblase CLPTM1 n=1 Tax=Condylostylus longicornis TaxID=2530218 RepID=UPI00244DEE58|nr:putative lipid scramblase CLPTM1 [Condylostylus longicornis]